MGRVACLAAGLFLAACATTPDDPQQNIPPQLADVTPMSQQDVDQALMAPELARAVKARAEHQPQAMLEAFTAAAEQGNAVAQYQLAQLYRSGSLVPQDDKAAYDWARMAAEEGLGEAEIMLAENYLAGRGVTADRDTGLQWLRLAVAQDRPAIWVMAGKLHLTGVSSTAKTEPETVLPADPEQARVLFQRAADIGNEEGELALCLYYMQGQRGSAPSPKTGQPWCDRAAARGNQEARRYTATQPALPQPSELPSGQDSLPVAILKGIGTGLIALIYVAAYLAASSGGYSG